MDHVRNTPAGRVIRLTPLTLNGDEQIALHFARNQEIRALVKAFPAVRWSQTHRCYYMRHSKENIGGFMNHIRGNRIYVDQSALHTAPESRSVPSGNGGCVKQRKSSGSLGRWSTVFASCRIYVG